MEPSIVLILAKEPFMRTIGDVIKQSNADRIELIKKQPLFAEWSRAQIASLFRHFIKKDIPYNKVIYKQGEVDENIYIVINGEVEVLKL